ncbi:hypothetical protein GCM10010991_03340 [Gemmobacter aquaticus]|uniref:Uncharacterized protein n=1 Tax=Gemmobacter aquaticus TaxID=490185 RepID=A0A917YGX0_9RHOB|nr:hypothetical protein GCM10010991_03340 [Gemmobacter aquaticus]
MGMSHAASPARRQPINKGPVLPLGRNTPGESRGTRGGGSAPFFRHALFNIGRA